MKSAPPSHGKPSRLGPAVAAALALGMLGSGGCAQLSALKARFGHTHETAKPAVATPAPAAAAPVGPLLPFNEIIRELQHGRYAEGERALRRYLSEHPNDRQAQKLLRQLTADPKHMLGERSHVYVVKAGDSYSTLASRYLGDARLFLILARYNDSSDPSKLRVGQKLRLPQSGRHALGALEAMPPLVVIADRNASASDTAPLPDATPVSPEAKAAQLQAQSLALLGQGHKDEALARLGEALSIDPRLKPDGNQETSLRADLLASYHQRAIVLYRNQQLNQAIALWDRILAIDPGYEPAIIYRARALELRQRLKQL